MADVTITSANKASINTTYLDGVVFGEAVSEGELVYKKASSGLYHVAHCETSLATAEVIGMALDTYAEDDVGQIATGGLVNTNAVLTADTSYYLSVTGLLMPFADFAANDYISFVGWAKSTSQIDLSLKNFGYQKA